jgi:glycosyltransferase involved in cell wall biosynthesis
VEVCFTMSRGTIADLIDNLKIKTHCLNMRSGFDLVNAMKLKELIKEGKYNIVHSHTDQLLTNFFISLSESSLKVMTGHGAIVSGLPVRKRFAHHLLKSILRSYDYLIGVSGFVRNSMITKFQFPSERVIVIRNGINLERFSKTLLPVKEQMEKLGLPPQKKIAGVVGRLFPDKGTDHLILAAPTVLQKSPECFFVVVGDGPLRQVLEAKVENMGLSNSFRFLGERDDIPEILSTIDVLVFPSVREGLPIAAIEGMAMGKPIVAYAVGGMPELVIHGETGLLVKGRDAILLAASIVILLDDKDLCLRMGAKARQVAQKFDIGVTAGKYIDLYLTALGNKKLDFNERYKRTSAKSKSHKLILTEEK